MMKWLLLPVALLALGAGPCGPAVAPAPAPDANDDGVVNVLDAAFVQSCTPVPDVSVVPACSAADTDGDGAVDSADLAVVINHFGIRVRVAGDLHVAGIGVAAPFADVSGAVGGSFVWSAASPDQDLRAAPGALSWATPAGSLSATLVRTNAPRRIDLTTGRPIRGDAPADATCTTGAGPDCASAGAPEAANPAAFDALCIEETSIFGCPLEFYQDLTTPGFFPVPMTTIFASILAGDNAPATLGGPTWFSALAPTSASFDTAVAAAAPFIAPCATCPPGTTYFDLVSASFRPSTIVALERGPEDGPAALESDYPPGVVVTPGIATLALLSGADPFLSAAQESLFGCGPFFDRSCDILGLHLFHSEAGAVLEALLPAAELRCGRIDAVGTWHVLPGCRGSADPGYDPLVDGSIASVNPYDGSSFRSETGAASWNFSQLQAGISPDLDPLDPFAAAGCNLQFPETCNGAVELLSNSTLTLADDPSGPPQRRWLWELGAEYLVAATSGDLAPYQGWSLFALGPEQPRLAGAQAGVAFLLQAPAGTTVPNTTPFLVRYPGADGATGTPDDPFRGAAYGETP